MNYDPFPIPFSVEVYRDAYYDADGDLPKFLFNLDLEGIPHERISQESWNVPRHVEDSFVYVYWPLNTSTPDYRILLDFSGKHEEFHVMLPKGLSIGIGYEGPWINVSPVQLPIQQYAAYIGDFFEVNGWGGQKSAHKQLDAIQNALGYDDQAFTNLMREYLWRREKDAMIQDVLRTREQG